MALVLVVDDDRVARDLSRVVLEAQGHEVLMAANGHEALEVLESGRPVEAVLTDLQMPGMDGDELRTILGRRYPALPLVLWTGARSVVESGTPADVVVKDPHGLDVAALVHRTPTAG